jgi:ABC-type antimicrobial peptide transport system permease subunit
VIQIEIHEQPPLGIFKTGSVCLSGIYHRLFRSFVTVAVIALAVAFVVMILGGALLRRAVKAEIEEDVRRDALFERCVAWLSRPLTRAELTAIIAGEDASARLDELSAWSGVPHEELAGLRTLAEEETSLRRFLEGLPAGRRRALIGSRSPDAAIDWLMTDEGFREFEERLSDLKSIQLPGALEGLRDFLKRRREAQPLRTRLREAHLQAIQEVRDVLGEMKVQDALLNPPEAFRESLAGLGFTLDEETLNEVRVAGQWKKREEALLNAIGFPDLRKLLARKQHKQFIELTVEVAMAFLATKEGAAWLTKAAEDVGLHVDLSQDLIAATAGRYMAKHRREQADEQIGRIDPGFWGLGERAGWLLIVSLVVCTVGISNAMLMSVTERFREIATMKCLGATDRTIVALFITESCVLGLAGGAVGALLGMILAVLHGSFAFGHLALVSLSFSSFLAVALASIAYGILLAGVAAVYPAIVAARLAPMEAMRVE